MARRNSRSVTDGQIFRRALGVGLLGAGLAAAGAAYDTGPVAHVAGFFKRFVAPTPVAHAAPADIRTHLWPEPLTEELRKKGFHECNPHDPIGLGPYTPFRNLQLGRLTIPQKGGHTDDMGFDVVVHFHGHNPVRKTLVQVAQGVAYVGIDRGVGSGVYSDTFANPDVFPTLVKSIEAGLKRATGDSNAHIRHLALSAWSAGYGAVNEILKYGDDRIDAVILLDGLHAAWKPGHAHGEGWQSVSDAPLAPTFKFARRAMNGEKIFIFTHSEVDPETYPSTRQTADLMLHELGLERRPLDPGNDRFGQTGTVDEKGFHLWSYRGANEGAHCTHISHIAPALHVIEDAWDTPLLDRSVPPTPAPAHSTPMVGGVDIEVFEEAHATGADAGLQPASLAAAALAIPLGDSVPAPAPDKPASANPPTAAGNHEPE